jgi:hypothetical protein
MHGIVWKYGISGLDQRHPTFGTRRVHGDRTALMGEGQCRKLMKRRVRSVDGELHCERCGIFVCSPGGEALVVKSLHHRRKRSQMPRWRQWEPSNCVLLCGDGTNGCHGWVEDHPEEAAVGGWHVYSYQEPSQIPLALWTGLTVWLDDLGNYADFTGVDNTATPMDNG